MQLRILDAITFGAVLSPCSYVHLVEEGIPIFELMEKVLEYRKKRREFWKQSKQDLTRVGSVCKHFF